jgi:hypothetical protein
MAGPLGVLAAGPTAATTEVGDVDGGPPDFHGDNEVSSAKKMLVVTNDPGGGGAGLGLLLLAPIYKLHSQLQTLGNPVQH